MEQFGECVLAIGMSDEFSFVFRRDTGLFNRRTSKINSVLCSCFATQYVFLWSTYFPTLPLQYAPQFDSRVVVYPTDDAIKDYVRWRQVDAHINNLYNTCFWKLVLGDGAAAPTPSTVAAGGSDSKKSDGDAAAVGGGMTERQAHDLLLVRAALFIPVQ